MENNEYYFIKIGNLYPFHAISPLSGTGNLLAFKPFTDGDMYYHEKAVAKAASHLASYAIKEYMLKKHTSLEDLTSEVRSMAIDVKICKISVDKKKVIVAKYPRINSVFDLDDSVIIYDMHHIDKDMLDSCKIAYKYTDLLKYRKEE